MDIDKLGKATSAERKQIKDACLNILSTFEDTIMTTDEINELVCTEFPEVGDIVRPRGKFLIGQVLFQIAENKNGKYVHIQNPSRGRYVYSRTRLPRRTDIGKDAKKIAHPTPKATPVARPVQAPKPVEVRAMAESHTINPIIEGAPNFTFVGKIAGRYIVRNDKGTLYVLQPAELA